ncbi:hypothetical protein H4Q26_013341 [Puccinia striiformis f. sp. tritici PST-130]|uniref:Uncharacterized protein n=1 Tax=Puccinia striiformis f. sp. tritici PST-78 TaxID=1165861 RepID=A0A0L0VNL3_9BASI|nr:hypothetical protein H4Q26_013341 [Puccinia striiformis f. sp. tritici PST-130]KNF00600.1 hypothetical protein PSTG_06016 [Puccinia striiformis f. sp. tritici PST-78]
MDIATSESSSVKDHIVQEVASQLSIQSALNDRIVLTQTLLRMSDKHLTRHIMAQSNFTYGQDPKPLQVQAVINLVRGRHTFLLAGTGFGKSRVSVVSGICRRFCRIWFEGLWKWSDWKKGNSPLGVKDSKGDLGIQEDGDLFEGQATDEI